MVFPMTEVLKFCRKCQTEKPIEEFWNCKTFPDGKQAWCKVCGRAATKAWVEKNHERQKESQRRWYQENREDHLERTAQWSANHLPQKAEYRRARRARLVGADGETTDELTQARMAYHGYRCIYCGGPFEEVDHAIPLDRGGSNWPANLVPSCVKCNRSKYTRTIWEYLELIK